MWLDARENKKRTRNKETKVIMVDSSIFNHLDCSSIVQESTE